MTSPVGRDGLSGIEGSSGGATFAGGLGWNPLPEPVLHRLADATLLPRSSLRAPPPVPPVQPERSIGSFCRNLGPPWPQTAKRGELCRWEMTEEDDEPLGSGHRVAGTLACARREEAAPAVRYVWACDLPIEGEEEKFLENACPQMQKSAELCRRHEHSTEKPPSANAEVPGTPPARALCRAPASPGTAPPPYGATPALRPTRRGPLPARGASGARRHPPRAPPRGAARWKGRAICRHGEP